MAGLTKASLPPRLFCDIRNRGAAVCVMLYEDGIVARETRTAELANELRTRCNIEPNLIRPLPSARQDHQSR
jgi:hypothetical protein